MTQIFEISTIYGLNPQSYPHFARNFHIKYEVKFKILKLARK